MSTATPTATTRTRATAAPQTPQVTLVDWFAPWCSPCKAMEPVLEELKKEFAGKVKFEAIDVDQQPDLANANGVMSMPTFHIKKGDKIVQTLIGYQNKPDLEKVLKAVLN